MEPENIGIQGDQSEAYIPLTLNFQVATPQVAGLRVWDIALSFVSFCASGLLLPCSFCTASCADVGDLTLSPGNFRFSPELSITVRAPSFFNKKANVNSAAPVADNMIRNA